MANTGLVIDYTIKPNEIICLEYVNANIHGFNSSLKLFKCLGTIKSGIHGPLHNTDFSDNYLSDGINTIDYIDLSSLMEYLKEVKEEIILIGEVITLTIHSVNTITNEITTLEDDGYKIISIEHRCYESLQGAHPCRILLKKVKLSGGSKHRRSKTRRQRSKTRRQRKNKRSTRRRQRKLVKSS